MAIKMRTNKQPTAKCCNCGVPRKHSLEMFDVCIADNIFTICDLCNNQLFSKTLSAECAVNHKLKSKEDMRVISMRRNKQNYSYGGKHLSVTEALRGTSDGQ